MRTITWLSSRAPVRKSFSTEFFICLTFYTGMMDGGLDKKDSYEILKEINSAVLDFVE
ncbi:MAG: hypothetical protein GX219_08895 [Tissierellia bacterium]|nr:hypothetical protein [Tissierellia bacterium]